MSLEPGLPAHGCPAILGAYACGALAGPLAETIHTHRYQHQDATDEDTDEFKAFEIADYFDHPTGAARWVNQMRTQTLETLRTPDVWAAVVAVATELVTRKTLTGTRVRFLVQRSGDWGPGQAAPMLDRLQKQSS